MPCQRVQRARLPDGIAPDGDCRLVRRDFLLAIYKRRPRRQEIPVGRVDVKPHCHAFRQIRLQQLAAIDLQPIANFRIHRSAEPRQFFSGKRNLRRSKRFQHRNHVLRIIRRKAIQTAARMKIPVMLSLQQPV